MKLRSFISALHAALLCILLAASPAGSGSMMLMGVGKVGATAPTYTGPGDVVASAKWYFGLRAYSAATRGTRAINACNSTGGVDVGCADLSTDATTGNLVAATVSGITCPGANCTVKIWYDQTTGGNCGGSCNVTRATVSQRPTLDASCLGSLPCAQFTSGASSELDSAGSFTQAQPLTVSSTFLIGTGTGIFVTDNSFNMQAIAIVAGPFLRVYTGTVQDTAISASTSYAVQSVMNGASSTISINGTGTSINPGTNGFSGALVLGNFGGVALDAKMFEMGGWSLAFSGGQQTSMCHNQFVYWGTATSC